MFCRKCGAKLADDASFCNKCGTPVTPNNEAEIDTRENREDTSSRVSTYDREPTSSKTPIIIGISVSAIVLAGVVLIVFLLTQNKSNDIAYDTVTTTEQQATTANNNTTSVSAPEEKSEPVPTPNETQESSSIEEEPEPETEPEIKDELDKYGDSDYILSKSKKKKLTNSDLKGLSAKELTFARNEIFARHGYVFGSPELNDYFESKTWYKKNKKFKSSQLSKKESQNADFIASYQKKKDKQYVPIPKTRDDETYSTMLGCVNYAEVRDGILIIGTEEIIDPINIGKIESIGNFSGEINNIMFYTNGNSITYEEFKKSTESEREYTLDLLNRKLGFESMGAIEITVEDGEISTIELLFP